MGHHLPELQLNKTGSAQLTLPASKSVFFDFEPKLMYLVTLERHNTLW